MKASSSTDPFETPQMSRLTEGAQPLTPPMTLLDHLLELRRRLIYALGALVVSLAVVYPFSQELFNFLVKPLANLISGDGHRLIYTGLTEAFVTYLKVSLFGAFVLASPLVLSQVWLFIAPGLYAHERKAFLGFLIATPLLFLAGAALAYSVVCPLAWQFFLSFEVPTASGGLPIQLEARVSEYLSLVMKLIFSFGLSFQLPIILLLLARGGLIQASKLKAQRKHAFLGIVVIAALITPPDFLSPLSLIIPIYGLYELTLALMCWQEKKRKG